MDLLNQPPTSTRGAAAPSAHCEIKRTPAVTPSPCGTLHFLSAADHSHFINSTRLIKHQTGGWGVVGSDRLEHDACRKHR